MSVSAKSSQKDAIQNKSGKNSGSGPAINIPKNRSIDENDKDGPENSPYNNNVDLKSSVQEDD